ncbi:hypothetical protein FHS11_001066 [Mucilaginibacter gotjawali]|uniref:Uncharacterized protein n=1 Tax=Mucilaginibacter gotjawali TaxID=1550579 RepID=A0A839S9Z7_9SPHI|nr:hypothetical protein [Mucilaginibacter gotjawali]
MDAGYWKGNFIYTTECSGNIVVRLPDETKVFKILSAVWYGYE